MTIIMHGNDMIDEIIKNTNAMLFMKVKYIG